MTFEIVTIKDEVNFYKRNFFDLESKINSNLIIIKKRVFQCAIQQRAHKHTHTIHCRIPGVLINESQFVKVPLFSPIGWISREYLFMVAFNILKFSFSLLNECDSFHFSFHALLFVCELISVNWNEKRTLNLQKCDLITQCKAPWNLTIWAFEWFRCYGFKILRSDFHFLLKSICYFLWDNKRKLN